MTVPLGSALLVIIHPSPCAHGWGLRPNPLENEVHTDPISILKSEVVGAATAPGVVGETHLPDVILVLEDQEGLKLG